MRFHYHINSLIPASHTIITEVIGYIYPFIYILYDECSEDMRGEYAMRN